MVASAFRLVDAVAPGFAMRVAIDRFLATTRRAPSPAAAAFRASGVPIALSVDGDRVIARSWGQGAPVLFLHGWNGSLADFRHLVPKVVDAGLRAVAVEARGHGESDGDDSSAIHLARALVAVGEEVGPAAGVVAHSLGGASAAWAVASGAVAAGRLALIAPAADPAAFIRGLASHVSEGFAERMLRAVDARVGVAPEALALVANATRLPHPTLIVHDGDDRETAFAPVARVVSDWASARLVRTESLGHRRILGDRSVVDAVVAHLAGRSIVPCPHGGLEATCDACVVEHELYRPWARPAA